MNSKIEKEIYLDNAATTKVSPEVIEVINRAMVSEWYNPSSTYYPTLGIYNALLNTRQTISNHIGAKPEEIFFVGSGCMGNTLILNSFSGNCENDICLIDSTSHISMLNHDIKNIRTIPVNRYGSISCAFLEAAFATQQIYQYFTLCSSVPKDEEISFVSICAVNNETGTTQNIEEINKLIKRYNPNTIFHVDAVQMFPYKKINVKELGIDCMTVSGHKFGTPAGIGFIYVDEKHHDKLKPLIYGKQEMGIIGGTENIPYILGLEKAVASTPIELHKYISVKNKLKNKLLSIANTFEVGVCQVPSILTICFKGIDATSLVLYLAMYGIYVSSGSACNGKERKESHVLKAMKFNEDEINSCIRFSINPTLQDEDIERVYEKINSFIKINNLNQNDLKITELKGTA